MSVATWLSGYYSMSICFIKNIIQLQTGVEFYIYEAMQELELLIMSSYYMKVGVAVCAVCAYLILVMLVKYLYMKNEILEHLDTVTSDAEKMMQNLYMMERKINDDIQQLQDIPC